MSKFHSEGSTEYGRRVCAPATGSNGQYSHFDATSAHQCISCCAEAAPLAPGALSVSLFPA